MCFFKILLISFFIVIYSASSCFAETFSVPKSQPKTNAVQEIILNDDIETIIVLNNVEDYEKEASIFEKTRIEYGLLWTVLGGFIVWYFANKE